MKRECEVCGSTATLSCSACNQSHYCGSDHRRRHWEAHRDHCRPLAERSDPLAGRYLVASRDVKAGELLLAEPPIALGPGAASDLVCLGCHRYISGGEFPRCPSCWWPLCSPACASASPHRAECPVLASDTRRIGQPKGPGVTPRYDVVLVLRCLLLRSTDPGAWRRLLDMASHARRREEEGDEHHRATTRYLTEVLRVDHEALEVQHARDAVVTNCFEWIGPSRASLRGVYPLLARLNHSCRPNVTVSSDGEGVMHARAATDLLEGDQLLIAYTSTVEPLWERRAYTTRVHYFACGCVRCGDPTELGLHYSSPRCGRCRGRFLEPTARPLEEEEEEEEAWQCRRCGLLRQGSDVRQEAKRWLARLGGAPPEGGPRALGAALEEAAEAFHPSHHVWVKAAQAAVGALKKDPAPEAVSLRRRLWLRLLQIYSVLEPGLSKRRGVTLYELGLAEAAQSRLEREGGLLDDRSFRLALTRALKRLQEAARILALEPETSGERRWHRMALGAAGDVAAELGVATPSAPGPPVAEAEGRPLLKERFGFQRAPRARSYLPLWTKNVAWPRFLPFPSRFSLNLQCDPIFLPYVCLKQYGRLFDRHLRGFFVKKFNLAHSSCRS